MSAADWYARKLGGGQAPAPVAPSHPPTTQSPYARLPYQPTPQQGQPYQEQQYQPPEEAPVEAGEDGSWFQQMATRAASAKRPPTVKAKETYNCPECGSNNFFTRASTRKRGPAPAPHCTECGYNGLFEQFGNQPDLTEGQQQ